MSGFTERVERWFSPASIRLLLKSRSETEDIFLKHAHLIEEYCRNTTKEWGWFIQEQPELDRRKDLLLQSIRQELLRSLSRSPITGSSEAKLPQTVHVLSPMQRSGTNLLGFLLVESASCRWPPSDRVKAEDFFLKYAHLIYEYCDKTCKELRWSTPDAQEVDQRKNLLLLTIGQGLLRFTDPDTSNTPIVLKTPDTDNIDLLPRLFPQSRVLFIIRDGRDTVDSAAKAFPLAGYEYWMNCWAQGARRLIAFVERAGANSQTVSWKLVRYEELIEEHNPVIQEILDFVNSQSRFTWKELQSLPVYGSSYLCRDNGKFTWEIKSKPENFNPVGRWRLWDEALKQKFKQIAGAELSKLGYEKEDDW